MTAPRDAVVSALRERTFDLLVIGGGIIGAGIARDAALRGFSVALVEQHDFGSGTTSRPTRLIHGGLRYLELFDFGLVRADMREREVLLRIAPHLVFPLPFLLPMYSRSALYRAKLQAGMQLYDLLSFDKSLPGRRWLGREEVMAAEPTLKTDGLQGAWRFYDAQIPLVERLVIENLLDAASHGAELLNHARATRALRDDHGRVTGALVSDLHGEQTIQVRARVTVNAAGPWLDLTTADLRPGRPPLLRLTKGVHLVTPSGSRNALTLFAKSDGRLFFVVPWLGYSLVGTTDTDYHGDPSNVSADEEDVSYLQAEARHALPTAPVDRVHYTMAGVRALVRVEGVKEGQVSRKHALRDHELADGIPGALSVVGGKITGYRGIAEEVVDLVAEKLGRRALGYTARRALPGGHLSSPDAFLEREILPHARSLGVDHAGAAELVQVYGSQAADVLALVDRDRSLGARLCPHHATIRAQVVRAIEREWAVSLSDVLLRRSPLGLASCQALGCLDGIASGVGELLGWDAAEREAQVAAYLAEIEPMRRLSSGEPTASCPPAVAAVAA